MVRKMDKTVGSGGAIRIETDTDAHADPALMSIDIKRRTQCIDELVGNDAGIMVTADIRQIITNSSPPKRPINHWL